MALAIRDSKQVMRPLRVLTRILNAYLLDGDKHSKQSIEFYRKAGEVLIEAKAQIAASEWRDWLRDNFHRSYSQARRYMMLAEEMARGVKHESVRDSYRPRVRKGGIPAEIRRIMEGVDVDVEGLSGEDVPYTAEKGMMHDLASEVIDAGYRVLAIKLHPDKGGSTEAMRRLNKVRDLLRAGVKGGLLLHE